MRSRLGPFVAAALVLLTAASARGQQPSAAAASPAAPPLPIPAVGDLAPDFAFKGATRYGLLRDPMRLSDFRGQTVVLWFFIKARTRG